MTMDDSLDQLFQTYTPYRGPPRQQQQSPSATNVRITKHVLERILHNPTFFTQINYDKPPEHCQYLKISEPTDLTLFPGGKNYQTKISNELKQIYSYTPGSYEKYQEMIKTKKVLKFAPEAPAKPKTPPPPPNQSVQRPPQQNGPKTVPHVSINGQLHQVFHLYDKSTGMTFKAIKRPGGEGFQAIGQSFSMANGNSGQQQMVTNGNQQQQFTQNSMNGAPVQMSQPIVIQQPQAQQIHIQNAPQQRQQQHQQQYQQQQQVQIQQPQQQMGSTMVINNTSSISSNGDNNDNGNNAYITSEVHLSNEARNSLEMQKKVIKTQIHQTRRQMVQSFMPRPVYQSPIAANSPKPVQVLMNTNYQPVKTRPPTLQRKVAPSPLSLTGQKFCVCKATFDQETQYGDIQCDLCQQPFHATCVGASPTEQFTCSPCHQKHTSARSTCICHSFDGKNGLLADRNAELNWCSCDVCQTWFHENCVSSEKTFVRLPNKDEISFMCTKCSQADLEIVNGPMTLSKLQLTEQIYSKFKNSRHSWPLKRKDIVCRIQTNMGFIESKLNQKLYKTFKQFMDEVFYCINFFREHYASTSAPESSFSNAKKEVKCCEILEYDFSYLIREFIAKERHKSAFVILPESHANIEENERAINAGMSSGAAANIFP